MTERQPDQISIYVLRAFVLAALTLVPLFASAGPAWLQYLADGHLAARTVVDGNCPKVTIDGSDSLMAPRGTPPAGQKPVCETDVSGARSVAVAGVPLHVPSSATPGRIVVLGDTGCRIKVGPTTATDSDDDDEPGGKPKIQNCNDKTKWPFQAVAQSAVAVNPDLLIHVGDYVYRETPCPREFAQDCANSPSGDQWSTWDADFFTPAKSLLAQAPWIFVRGNHEICTRTGKGWFYYFGPGPYVAGKPCSDVVAAYTLRIGAFESLVVDSSSAPDQSPPPQQIDVYAEQFRAASGHLNHAWLLTHRPIWAAKVGPKGDRTELRTLNATLEQAWARQPVAGIDLVVSGHTHLFELASLGPTLPLQIVVGNGGTKLSHALPGTLTGEKIGTATVARGVSNAEFGFVIIEPSKRAERWTLRLRDSHGHALLKCSMASEAHCEAN